MARGGRGSSIRGRGRATGRGKLVFQTLASSPDIINQILHNFTTPSLAHQEGQLQSAPLHRPANRVRQETDITTNTVNTNSTQPVASPRAPRPGSAISQESRNRRGYLRRRNEKRSRHPPPDHSPQRDHGCRGERAMSPNAHESPQSRVGPVHERAEEMAVEPAHRVPKNPPLDRVVRSIGGIDGDTKNSVTPSNETYAKGLRQRSGT